MIVGQKHWVVTECGFVDYKWYCDKRREDAADVNHRGHSRPEIPEISKLSWNRPEITDCPEILGIW